ncbi:MAG: GTP-binding protein [Deltaproteobacteria bacterium]|nr:MAG: GTP-binding protein [Deltaproteobacteria bacterium]
MIPVVVLTGFLGSGKTTLLNRLFRARPPGRGRFAIVVNEFGDVGVDAALLPSAETRQVELPGGCVCCQLVDDLQTTLDDLVEAAPDLDTIVIETTGIANPLPISWTLESPPLDARLRLAAIVAVVDPFEHEAARRESPSADAQVRYADLLVVSKLDRGPRDVDALVASLRERNDAAPILLEPPERVAPVLWRFLEDPPPPAAAGVRDPAAGDHADGLTSVAVDAPDVYDLEALAEALEALPPSIIRMKGVLRVVDGERGALRPALYAVHRVGARVSAEPAPAASPTPLVAIGRDVDPAGVADCLRAAVLPSESG